MAALIAFTSVSIVKEAQALLRGSCIFHELQLLSVIESVPKAGITRDLLHFCEFSLGGEERKRGKNVTR